MIIRTEKPAVQTGLLQTGFDTMNSTFGPYEVDPASPVTEKDSPDPILSNSEPLTAKKRWSMFSKLMSFSTPPGVAVPMGADAAKRNVNSKDELAEARRATAAERSGSQHPKKMSHSSHESDASSTGSMPVYEAAQFVFKFTLGSLPWNPNAELLDAASAMLSTLPRERPLSRPRLPAPAQAKIAARAASAGSGGDNAPASRAILPPAKRIRSGTSDNAVYNGARSTTPPEEPETDSDQETPTAKEGQSSDSVFPLPEPKPRLSDDDSMDMSLSMELSNSSTIRLDAQSIAPPTLRSRSTSADHHDRLNAAPEPVQPAGIFKDRATYAGRALAEWGLVCHECNSFIDRRREEGVFGLREVEVPSLGVENLRRAMSG